MNKKNDQYSHKDFTGKIFINNDPEEFNHTCIVGSCFSQESDGIKKIEVFPQVVDLQFKRSNLDNVNIQPGMTLIDDGLDINSHRLIDTNIKIEEEKSPKIYVEIPDSLDGKLELTEGLLCPVCYQKVSINVIPTEMMVEVI